MAYQGGWTEGAPDPCREDMQTLEFHEITAHSNNTKQIDFQLVLLLFLNSLQTVPPLIVRLEGDHCHGLLVTTGATRPMLVSEFILK